MGYERVVLLILLAAVAMCALPSPLSGQPAAGEGRKIVQAQVVLTVSESKRLIARAVAQMPIVSKALKDGMIIICRGTTNTYVAEEILGREIEHGALVSGRVYPAKGGKRLAPKTRMQEIVLIKGKLDEDLSLADAVKKLQPGDVVIKGANALDYESQTAGVLLGSTSSGTAGKFMPYLVGNKAHLLIPVGLEKQVAGDVLDIANKMREPVESLNRVPSMFFLTGHIVTEIEALKTLAEVSAFQVAAGGIGGAEGSVRLLVRGTRQQVEKAMKLVDEVQGEPPFVQ